VEPVSPELRWLVATSPGMRVRRGLELLNDDLSFADDVSSWLAGGSVLRQNYADEHLSASLHLTYGLPWERTRLRPYVTLTDGATSVRCDLGVVVPKRPRDALGLTPTTYEVSCTDLIVRLRREIETDFTYPAGTDVLAEVRTILAAQGLPAPLFDGEATGKTLAYPMPFEVVENDVPTWLRVVNRLLASIGYRSLYLDGQGRPRSGPYAAPVTRPVEWTFDAQAPDRIVDTRSVSREVEAVDAPNVWRFYQRGNATPTEGAGLYVVTNQSDGPNSIDAVGRNASTRWLDAVDQAALIAQGNRAVDSDRRRLTVYRVNTSPFPVFGHFDIYRYVDTRLNTDAKILARSCRVDLGKGNSEHVWEAVA